MFGNKSPEKVAEREQQAREAEQYKKIRQEQAAKAAFDASPAGKARASYARNDQLFQVSLDLENVQAVVVPMMGAFSQKQASDISEVLNSILAEGWNFQAISTTFVNEGEESRDKFMSSGQNTAIRGRVMGTYVFSRR